MNARRLLKRDDGVASIEMALLGISFVIIFLLMAYSWRVSQTIGDVSDAAAEVARAASIDDDNAEAIAQESLAGDNIACGSVNVSVSGGGVPAGDHPGNIESVTATVSCVVPLSDLALIGVPGTQTIEASHTEVIDVYIGGRP